MITVKRFCKELKITKRQFYGLDIYPENLVINNIDIPDGFSMKLGSLFISKKVTIFGKFTPTCDHLVSSIKDLRRCTEFRPIVYKSIHISKLKTLPKNIGTVDWRGLIKLHHLKSFPKSFRIKYIDEVDEIFANSIKSLSRSFVKMINGKDFDGLDFEKLKNLPNLDLDLIGYSYLVLPNISNNFNGKLTILSDKIWFSYSNFAERLRRGNIKIYYGTSKPNLNSFLNMNPDTQSILDFKYKPALIRDKLYVFCRLYNDVNSSVGKLFKYSKLIDEKDGLHEVIDYWGNVFIAKGSLIHTYADPLIIIGK